MTLNSTKLLETIIATAIDGIITIDSSGIIESINPSALKVFGYEAHEVIGRNISMLMPEPDRSRHDNYIENYHNTGVKKIIGIGREVLGLKKDGSTFPFRLAVSEVKLEDKIIFAGFVHDLSKEKEAERHMLHYTEELEKTVSERTKDLIDTVVELEKAKADVSQSLQKEIHLNQMKTQFVSMASHEFRTPLSSIQLSASLIEKYLGKGDEQNIKRHLDRIRNSVQLLTTILNDFLSHEKLESGGVKANCQEINLVKLSEEITEEMQMICKANQHIVYQHTGAEGTFYLDSNLIKNAVINLISNSIKFSGENSFIEFNTEITGEVCKITVKDNGIGIPKADQSQLFEPFFRANNTGNIPGTGLGLNIVRRYVELMNGVISFKSSINQGTYIRMEFDRSKLKEI